MEYLARERGFPSPRRSARPQREVGRILIAIGGLERKAFLPRRASEEFNDAAESVASVQTRSSFLRHFDAIHSLLRDSIPIDPGPKRVVQRDVVFENEHAARAVCSDTAQRNALRGRICGAATRSAKQGETGNLAQRVIEGEIRSRGQIVARELPIADGGVSEGRWHPRRHRHLLRCARRVESDFEVRKVGVARVPIVAVLLKVGRTDDESAGSSCDMLKDEISGGRSKSGCRVGL